MQLKGLSVIALAALSCFATLAVVTPSAEGDFSIVCSSGGIPLYDGLSVGPVEMLANRQGWQFQEQTTGETVLISGDCVIRPAPVE
jgi:hypothetical protein